MTHATTPWVRDATIGHVAHGNLAVSIPNSDRWADVVREISARGIEVCEEQPTANRELQALLQRVAEGIHPI